MKEAPAFRDDMSTPVDLLIASRLPPDMQGGLAQYQRALAKEFQNRDEAEVLFCSATRGSNSGSLPAPVCDTCDLVREPRAAWMHLASRPLFHPLLQAWITRRYAPVIKRLAARKPKVVHYVGGGWDFLGFAMRALARQAGVRFTIWPAVHPGCWGDDAIDIRLYERADTVFCQSDFERQHLQQLGVTHPKLRLCGLPPLCRPDGDGSRLRSRLQMGNRPAILFLGRRETSKGYPALLEAWPQVLSSHPEAILLLAGVGDPVRPETLPPDSFRDLGSPDETEKADALAACDGFCLPSKEEAFGIVYPEAWSYGKPVICGPAPAPREWIKAGSTGLWTDQNPGDIATAILRLLDDETLRLRLGAAGKEFQRRELTWERIAPIHREEFYV